MKLRKPCPHDRYEEHPCIDGRWVSQARMMNLKPEERPLLTMCPGGSEPTAAQLFAELFRPDRKET